MGKEENKKIGSNLKRTFKKIKYLDKTQSSYFIVTCLIATFLMFTGITYAYFTYSKHLGAATITIAKLNYSLESSTSGYFNGSVTVGAGETVFVDLDLRSLNTERTRYGLNYESTSNNVKVYYSESLKENMTGIIGATGSVINMRIIIVNSGTSSTKVKFTIDGGYLQNTVSSNITEGYFEVDQTIRYVTYDTNFENETVKSSIPSKDDYAYYKSECSNSGVGSFDESSWTFTITSSGQTSCDVYFKKVSSGLETYYSILGSNGIRLYTTTKPDTNGLYTYTSSSCSNGATFTFNETTFEFNVTNYTANTLCVANFTTNQELQLADRYIVTFDSNGGTRSYSKEVYTGGTYGDLPEATRSGYELIGWFTDPTDGEEITSTTPVTITVNQTLYAHWGERKTYTAADSLAALKLTNSVATEPTTYNMFDYTYNGYQYDSENSEVVLVDGIKTTEGIYATEDDFGTSYYFRGSRSLNNVVKFGTYDSDMYYYAIGTNKWSTGSLSECQAEATNTSTYCTDSYKYASAGDPMYWRIVRINGDGSLRLMYIGTSATATGLNSVAGVSSFNASYDDPKYMGYTYDNSTPNAGDGTASDIKNYLDTWYAKNMSDEDKYIASAQFYSDTTNYHYNDQLDVYMYSTANRLDSTFGSTDTVTPSLKTDLTTETYGGVYNLKVGLLNADELVLSGYDGVWGAYSYGDETTYPYTTNTTVWCWSFSPAVFINDAAGVFDVPGDGGVRDNFVDSDHGVVPVINLSAEYVATMTGVGSTTNPYTV